MGKCPPLATERATLPPDAIVQLFAGADHPVMPVDSLVTISKLWQPPPPLNFIGPGTLVICRPLPDTSYEGEPLLFVMGMMVAPEAEQEIGDGSFAVQWWLPPMSREANFRPGRRKLVVDIFGAWKAVGEFSVQQLGKATLPPAMVRRQDVLECGIVLEDEKIPFAVFDALRINHNIDVSALSRSMTHEGNRYRAYVLMRVGSA